MSKNYAVAFIDQKTKKSYEELKGGKYEDKELYEEITKAINRLKQDPSYGLLIHHNLIPKEYIKKYQIENLRKINLSDGWRLMYSVQAENVLVISVILEWLDHKNYERRFKY